MVPLKSRSGLLGFAFVLLVHLQRQCQNRRGTFENDEENERDLIIAQMFFVRNIDDVPFNSYIHRRQ